MLRPQCLSPESECSSNHASHDYLPLVRTPSHPGGAEQAPPLLGCSPGHAQQHQHPAEDANPVGACSALLPGGGPLLAFGGGEGVVGQRLFPKDTPAAPTTECWVPQRVWVPAWSPSRLLPPHCRCSCSKPEGRSSSPRASLKWCRSPWTACVGPPPMPPTEPASAPHPRGPGAAPRPGPAVRRARSLPQPRHPARPHPAALAPRCPVQPCGRRQTVGMALSPTLAPTQPPPPRLE